MNSLVGNNAVQNNMTVDKTFCKSQDKSVARNTAGMEGKMSKCSFQQELNAAPSVMEIVQCNQLVMN